MNLKNILIRLLAHHNADEYNSTTWDLLTALRGPDIDGLKQFPYDYRQWNISPVYLQHIVFSQHRARNKEGFVCEQGALKLFTTARLRGILNIHDAGLMINPRPLTDGEVEFRNVLLSRAGGHFRLHFIRGLKAAREIGFHVPKPEYINTYDTGGPVQIQYARDLPYTFLEDKIAH